MFSKHNFGVADELSTPDDKTMFSHNDFTTGDSSTVLQICSVGMLLNVFSILSISPLNINSANSTIYTKSSQGQIVCLWFEHR